MTRIVRAFPIGRSDAYALSHGEYAIRHPGPWRRYAALDSWSLSPMCPDAAALAIPLIETLSYRVQRQ